VHDANLTKHLPVVQVRCAAPAGHRAAAGGDHAHVPGCCRSGPGGEPDPRWHLHGRPKAGVVQSDQGPRVHLARSGVRVTRCCSGRSRRRPAVGLRPAIRVRWTSGCALADGPVRHAGGGGRGDRLIRARTPASSPAAALPLDAASPRPSTVPEDCRLPLILGLKSGHAASRRQLGYPHLPMTGRLTW